MLKSIWESHGGRILGAGAGIGLGIIYFIVGFWDMLFFALLVFIGFTLGKQRDLNLGSIFPWARIWEWLTSRWSMFK
ncbi:hypothetical protein BVG16_03240 [Paenibacillus selenitireducens]|uniref:DUF2273 domain-containing protein n=1 Tax=Paenibacillus selenitireducens TaxID=1324314 RepID=A0A1T2XNU3_9BACL|nr:DUF2273 domain-containing protein [Paenibacillus selenitireducens]OPA81343.1 hypothetical protein BVG16_03240 [Paenibacillus selenitireducens]